MAISGVLPAAVKGVSYNAPLTVSGGIAPYQFTVATGQLPTGLALGATTGTISGMPSSTGSFSFTVSATDSSSNSASHPFQVTVSNTGSVAVAVTPITATVASGATQQFTALVSNTSNVAVTWTAFPGMISSSGLYTAPTVSITTNAIVTATSVADPTKSGRAAVTVTAGSAPPTLSITTTSLSGATTGSSYSNALVATGGKSPYTWTLTSGTLPSGIALQSSGSIFGTTNLAGQFTFTVQVADSSSPRQTATKSLTLTVSAATVTVSIIPATATVSSGASKQFTAVVSNTANVAVTWSASPGSISNSGLYQSPTVTSTTTATVTATSVASPTTSGKATVTVTAPAPPPTLSITTTSLSGATSGSAYSTSLSATGGTSPYSWTLISGTLPAGIALQSSGTISGTTSQTGQFNITVQASDSSSPKQTATRALTLTVSSSTGGGPLPPATFFGFTDTSTQAKSFPTVSYGMQRFWDSPPLQWPSINTASGVFDFSNLDATLATGYSSGVMYGMYTLARTPPWASSNPSDSSCHYTTAASGGGLGECDAPSDLNSDGSGSNAIWKAWITAIATHANNATYLQTHSHIKYWEIWNEPDNQPFWSGSFAQLARLTEDANCIITGRGAIHENGNGTATPCTATAIDPTAQIVMSSGHAKGAALTYAQNQLYCNAAPTGYQLPCPIPGNAIATAVDIINFHLKPGNETGNNCPAPTPCTPESAMQMYLNSIHGLLQPAELAKPLWDGEASYAMNGFTNAYTDPDMAASFMPRFYLVNWSLNISGMAWYDWGELVAQPASVQTAYQQTYNWLANSSLSTPCSASGSVWSCGVTQSGKQYLIMWDNAQSCSNGSCTTANQTVASQWTKYQDMTTASSTSPISGHVIPLGIKPVVLQ
jgi:iron uptake system EfeUOB component EfeO/EfeM